MTNTWFRFYSEFSHDPKVQMMTEAMQRRLVMLMCLRCSNVTETLHETELAFHLRITDAELAETKSLFMSKGFIDDRWNLLNWDKRQFKSDSSAERVSRHRAKKKQQCNGEVTLQKRRSNVLDTDTDTDKNNTPARKRAVCFDARPKLIEMGVTAAVADDFLALRKKKRAPLTETALTSIQREADKAGLTLQQTLEKCCSRGWQGFEASWLAGFNGEDRRADIYKDVI